MLGNVLDTLKQFIIEKIYCANRLVWTEDHLPIDWSFKKQSLNQFQLHQPIGQNYQSIGQTFCFQKKQSIGQG
jgi:hypothetical protein